MQLEFCWLRCWQKLRPSARREWIALDGFFLWGSFCSRAAFTFWLSRECASLARLRRWAELLLSRDGFYWCLKFCGAGDRTGCRDETRRTAIDTCPIMRQQDFRLCERREGEAIASMVLKTLA